jgi:hypothetical protein
MRFMRVAPALGGAAAPAVRTRPLFAMGEAGRAAWRPAGDGRGHETGPAGC